MIISTAELSKYFGKEVTPAKMKEQIMALLDEWKEKQPPELAKPDKNRAWDGLCGDISPVAAYIPAQPGVGRQGCNAPPLAAACP